MTDHARDALRDGLAKAMDWCPCSQGPPEMYEGPMRECPTHGDANAVPNEVLAYLLAPEHRQEVLSALGMVDVVVHDDDCDETAALCECDVAYAFKEDTRD